MVYLFAYLGQGEKASAQFPQVRNWFPFMKPKSKFLSLILLVFLTTSCSKSSSPPPASNDYTAFNNPQLVTINSYTSDAMEPFISRDGQYLFFNSNTGGATDKDIYYAPRVDDTTSQTQAPITAINSSCRRHANRGCCKKFLLRLPCQLQ